MCIPKLNRRNIEYLLAIEIRALGVDQHALVFVEIVFVEKRELNSEGAPLKPSDHQVGLGVCELGFHLPQSQRELINFLVQGCNAGRAGLRKFW